jgi:hypothetical protein
VVFVHDAHTFMGSDITLLVIDELDFNIDVYYILYNCYIKKIEIIKICSRQFDQEILL